MKKQGAWAKHTFKIFFAPPIYMVKKISSVNIGQVLTFYQNIASFSYL
jgi:hypothetical protein